ncbi:MAG: glycosyltransferase family 2 protein [Acidimicrobiales bacterium]
MPRPRVLLGIHVQTAGRETVPAAVRSVPGLRVGHRDVDVLVVDETPSGRPGADRLRIECEYLDLGYYRSPRSLGAPRAMNLILLRAMAEGYDHVLATDGGAVLPLNLVDALVSVAGADPTAGSVAAWSNALPLCPLPVTGDPDLADRQDLVDWVSSELALEFGPAAVELPASGGPCLLLPVPAVRAVGLFDPVYGTVSLEWVDWTMRSRAAGYHAVLAPSSFVLSPGDSGWAGPDRRQLYDQDRVIAFRHPRYRDEADAFASSGTPEAVARRGLRTVLVGAAARHGYEVEVAALDRAVNDDRVVARVAPIGDPPVVAIHFRGFRIEVLVLEGDIGGAILGFFDRPPLNLAIVDRGPSADWLLSSWHGKVPMSDRHMYPQSV